MVQTLVPSAANRVDQEVFLTSQEVDILENYHNDTEYTGENKFLFEL